MTVLAEEVDRVLHLSQGANLYSHRRRTSDLVEHTGLEPGPNRRRREPQDLRCICHLHAAIASSEAGSYRIERLPALGVFLVLGETLEGDEIVHHIGHGHGASVAETF